MAVKEKIEDIYKKLTQEEHVLLRPDTYVGSVQPQEKQVWAVKNANDLSNIEIRKQNLRYVPAFLKLFDEILTNASDHVQRQGSNVKSIKVNITPDWKISVWNDGKGIPIEIHKDHKIYVPELIFGHMLTGSNYDDSEERFGAGRNGIGSKAVALFSKEFVINCSDGKKSYYQTFKNNLKVKDAPVINKSTQSYTQITYVPDFVRLPIKGMEQDTFKLCLKRVIDIAAYIPHIKVFFNDTLIQVNDIKDWCSLHLAKDEELFIEKINDRWNVGLAQSNGDFDHCSIVNGNTTWQGGTHVDHIMNNVCKRLIEDLTKGNKGIKLRPSDIRSKFHLFLISKVPNPTFDTQTKENLTLKIEDKVDLSDKMYKLLMKSNIIQTILEWVQMKEQMELNKMNKRAAGKTVRVDKLIDAHKAGTNDGWRCGLFITEGDSAKSTILSGLSVVGREHYGIFPLKGKPLNVRDAGIAKITQNDEIANVLQIVGLVPGKKYTTLAELRYGKLIFTTDADVDGVSIKGLLINFIHKMWPELLDMGFCYEFITPIVIAKKGKDSKKEYFNISNYYADKKNGKLEGWNVKYYKGLGTILANEIKEMFKSLDKHLIKFKYDKERDSDKIDMLFNKTRANDRKDWLLGYEGTIIPDKFGKPNQLDDFFDKEFIQFSNYDNIRSIPQLMDGLKPSLRKILYATLKKNVTTDMKVAQLGAYVAEQTHYAHGEGSLMAAIVGMAQDFIGSNNINLLVPEGQFGTRNNPDSAASPRYIFTYLNKITRLIFKEDDDKILKYLDEDGDQIEPETYLPIIPMILVNGTEGIGTGWSTDIPKYSPTALIQVIKKKLTKDVKYKINPWFKHFDGELDWNDEKAHYITKGVYQRTKKGVLITELPINVWTERYTKFLDGLCDDKIIKNYIDNSTDTKISIEVHLQDDWTDLEVESKLKLTSPISMSNMHTFIGNSIKKWSSAEEMLDHWFTERLKWYKVRKEHRLKELDHIMNRYMNTYAFLKAVVDGDLVVNNRKKDALIKDLDDMEFMKIEDCYDYLLNIPVHSFTKEKIQEWKDRANEKRTEHKEYKLLKPEDIWAHDLDVLDKELKKQGY